MTDTMELVVSAGHGEYGRLIDTPLAEILWNPTGDEETWNALQERGLHADQIGLDETEEGAAALFRETTRGIDPPDGADLTWEMVVRLRGTREEIGAWLDELIADISETPSGDDTVFDYWPSGVRLARDVAAALGRDAEVEQAIDTAIAGTGITREEVSL